jgi:hypothetical protein
MKLTRAHLDFYRAAKVSTPHWGEALDAQSSAPSVHHLINMAAGIKHDLGTHNTLVILKSARHRGVLRDKLAEMSKHPAMRHNPERRAANCRKWLRRLVA